MAKLNCWQYMKCGREPRGINAAKSGICTAATEKKVNGMNGGKNAGRLCWVIAGTFCLDNVQGTYAKQIQTCLTCDFLKLVAHEEGLNHRIC